MIILLPVPGREPPDGRIPLSALFPVIREVLELTGSFTLTVTGTSMEPFLRHLRDRATLAPPDGRTPRRGDIALYRRDSGAYVLHRIRRVARDGTYAAVGDAQWIAEDGIRPDQLLARVTRVERNGRAIDCERGAWRAAMTGYMLVRMRFPRLARAILRAVSLARNPASALRALKRKLAPR